MARPSPQVRRAGRSPLLAELLLTLSDQDDHPTHDLATAAGNSALKATPEDARSNPVFQRAELLLASIRQEIREQGGPTNPELLQEKDPAAVWHLLDGLKRFDSLDPRRVGEITFEVARLGESLSRRHKDTEKSSCSERRRPRRHHRLSAMTLRKLRETQCVKMRGDFLHLPDSNASLPSKTLAWL